jgi:putative FmdB family regulatory protein
MATYEYKCPVGHIYTEVRSMTEEQRRTTCPKPDCSGKLVRVFSAPPVTFKGTGFHTRAG